MEWLTTVMTHPITLIAIGSAMGGNARYWLGQWVMAQPWSVGLPWGTFLINVTGSFLLGFIAVVVLEQQNPPIRKDVYLLLGTGFCGGYTTFSSFEWETLQLIREGHWPLAAVYVVSSCLIGLAGVALGATLANWLWKTG